MCLCKKLCLIIDQFRGISINAWGRYFRTKKDESFIPEFLGNFFLINSPKPQYGLSTEDIDYEPF